MDLKNVLKCCKRCGINKNRNNDYYHDSAGYCTAYCKPCSKIQRRRYVMNSNYTKRQTGLLRKSPEIREIIKNMREQSTPIIDIATASGVPSATLYLWRQKGII